MRTNGRSRLVDLATALYGLVLRFWTRELRVRYRDDAVRLFRLRLKDARDRGRKAVARAALRGLAEAVREVARGKSRTESMRGGSGGRIETFWGERMATMTRDIGYALRRLRRSPRFSLVMIVTFAIAVAVTTASHAAAYRLLLAPLPFPEADRLVFIGEVEAGSAEAPSVTSRYVLDLLGRTSVSLEGVATFNIATATLTAAGDPATLNGATVTTDYFDVLGVRPRLGRGFQPGDGGAGAPPRVILSDALWRNRLGSDPGAVGRSVLLDGVSHHVIGVMPADFESPDEYTFTNQIRGRPSFWIPYRSAVPGNLGRSHRGVGRLAAGATLDQLRAEAASLPARVEVEGLDWPERQRVVVEGLQEHVTAGTRPILRLLLLAVAFVFLAACVNAMGLGFARGLDRRGELRMKGAFGAGRGRLLWEMVLESGILGLVGGALGVALGGLSLDLLVSLAPADVPRLNAVHLEPPTVALVMVIAVVAAVAVGLLPGHRLLWGRHAIGPAAEGGRATVRRGHRRTLDSLAGAQVAFALVLLTGSVLLARSFLKLTRVELGFEPRGLVIAVVDLPAESPQERRNLEDELLRHLSADPSVASVALATTAPQHGLNDFQVSLTVEGYTGEQDPISFYRRVTDDFAQAMEMRLLRGRFLSFADVTETDAGRLGPVVVNEAFAQRYLQGRDALGAELSYGGWAFQSTRVVGVVDDARFGWPGAPPGPALYLPLLGEFSTVFMVARASGDLGLLPPAIRRAVAQVAPAVAVDQVFFSERLVRATTASTEMSMTLLLGLALFTTALTCVGLYGIVAHAIASRRREMGIRMATGATAGRVVGLVVTEGMRPVGVGLVLGTAGAAAAGGVTEALLFGVERGDPVSYAASALLLACAGAAACYLPARRIGRLDPSETLRAE